MIVCSCRAVNDASLRAAVAAGASTPEDLARTCDAGNRCGGCWPALERFVAEHCRPANRAGDLRAAAA
jgi:bacterioferritin-associated ferredoxin